MINGPADRGDQVAAGAADQAGTGAADQVAACAADPVAAGAGDPVAACAADPVAAGAADQAGAGAGDPVAACAADPVAACAADPVAAGAADQAGAGAADSVAAHPAGADSADTAGGNGVDNPGIADPDDTGGAGSVAAPSRRVAGGGGSQLDQFMPVVLFLVFYNLVNTEIAVLAATAWSVKAAYSRRRRGLPIGTWLPAITAYLLVRAVISIAVERELVDFGVSAEAVYFGIGIGTKMLVGLAAAATILVGRPLAVWAVRWVADLPDEVRSDRRFISTLRDVTWVIAFYEIGSSVWDIWLFNNSGVNVFLITRQVVNFAAAFALIFATLAYVDRRFSKIDGCPSLVEMVSRTTRRNPASGP